VLNFAIVFCLTLETVVGQGGYKLYHTVILLPFWVMWRYGSHDHKICSGWFSIGGPLTPTLYLASLLRYYASSVRSSHSHHQCIGHKFREFFFFWGGGIILYCKITVFL